MHEDDTYAWKQEMHMHQGDTHMKMIHTHARRQHTHRDHTCAGRQQTHTQGAQAARYHESMSQHGWDESLRMLRLHIIQT